MVVKIGKKAFILAISYSLDTVKIIRYEDVALSIKR